MYTVLQAAGSSETLAIIYQYTRYHNHVMSRNAFVDPDNLKNDYYVVTRVVVYPRAVCISLWHLSKDRPWFQDSVAQRILSYVFKVLNNDL